MTTTKNTILFYNTAEGDFMITEKMTTLRPIFESTNGIHLTAYLINQGCLLNLKRQLRQTIQEAHEWLQPALSLDERRKFLEPLVTLIKDTRILNSINGNIGIFRNEESFRIINIPIEIQQSCQVASSFHVKPLLRWLQCDQEFLLLGLEEMSANLYLGSQNTFRLIDSMILPNSIKKLESNSDCDKLKKAKQLETFSCLGDWISKITNNYKPILFLAGKPSYIKNFQSVFKYKKMIKNPISSRFSKEDTFHICNSIRKILKEDSKKSLEKILMEFRFAEEGNRTKKNIFQISKAVVQGKVRKLIVTDELSIFGKIDLKSGGLSIHPTDLDHEDDCILDDLAQIVLSQGGEVIIAKRDEIPNGRPILAILDGDEDCLEKTIGYQLNDLQLGF